MKGGQKICKIEEKPNWWEEMVKMTLRKISLRVALARVYDHISDDPFVAYNYFPDTDEADTDMAKSIIEGFDNLKNSRDCWSALALSLIAITIVLFVAILSYFI